MPHWTDFLDPDGADGAYLPWKKVEPRVGISRTTAWRLQKAGDFPSPYVVSPGRVAYRESEVEAWKASRGHRNAPRQVARPRPQSASAAPVPRGGAVTAPDAPQAPVEPPLGLEATPDPPPPHDRRPARPSPRSRAAHSSDRQITFDF